MYGADLLRPELHHETIGAHSKTAPLLTSVRRLRIFGITAEHFPCVGVLTFHVLASQSGERFRCMVLVS